MADQTEQTRRLRQAAHTFAQLANGNTIMHDAEGSMPSGSKSVPLSSLPRRSFFTRRNSPWDNSVRDVVDSVHTMANSAASIGDYLHGSLPVLQPSLLPQPSAVSASQWALRSTLQESREKTGFQPSSIERSPTVLLDRSPCLESASTRIRSPASTRRDNEQRTPVVDSSEDLECNTAPVNRCATLAPPIQVPAEQMATIYPLCHLKTNQSPPIVFAVYTSRPSWMCATFPSSRPSICTPTGDQAALSSRSRVYMMRTA